MRFQHKEGYAVMEDTLIKTFEASPDFKTVSFMEWLKQHGFLLPKPSEAS